MVLLYHNSHAMGIHLFLVHEIRTSSGSHLNMYFPFSFLTDLSFDRQTVACQTPPKVEVDFQTHLEDHYNFYHHVHLSFLQNHHAQVHRIDPFHHQPCQVPLLPDWE